VKSGFLPDKKHTQDPEIFYLSESVLSFINYEIKRGLVPPPSAPRTVSGRFSHFLPVGGNSRGQIKYHSDKPSY